MTKFIKRKLSKKRLAYVLSAAIMISFTPVAAFAAEDNVNIINENGGSIQATAATTGPVITDGSQTGTVTTDGSISPGNSPATGGALTTTTPQETVTGGSLTTGTPAPSGTTPPAIIIPVSPSPGTTATTPPAVTTSPAIDNQPGTVTGGATGPDSTPPVTTGGSVTPGNPPETPAPSATPSVETPAIGTKITVGKYIYKITSSNTVVLKGFAKDVSLATVTAKNQITYKNVVYKVTKVGASAFKGDAGIKKVVIRKNITDIAADAFHNCTSITKVTIRTGVTIIRKQAFMGCSKLKTVNITSPVLEKVKKNAFKNIKNGAVINVINNKAKKAVKASIPANITVNQM